MKAVVAAFNQEKVLVGAFSVITNLRMELIEALHVTGAEREVGWEERQYVGGVVAAATPPQPGRAAVARQGVTRHAHHRVGGQLRPAPPPP